MLLGVSLGALDPESLEHTLPLLGDPMRVQHAAIAGLGVVDTTVDLDRREGGMRPSRATVYRLAFMEVLRRPGPARSTWP
jgi:hypothetical protein